MYLIVLPIAVFYNHNDEIQHNFVYRFRRVYDGLGFIADDPTIVHFAWV